MSASDAAYLVTATLVVLGLLGLVQTPNLLRKLMALNILQVAVIVFFILLGHKTGAAPPTAPHGGEALRASDYANPLPHTLMLTAIVVAVSTTGVALALLVRISRRYGTLEEDELLKRMSER